MNCPCVTFVNFLFYILSHFFIICNNPIYSEDFCTLKNKFMVKALSKLRIEGNVLNPKKNIYKKPTANIILMLRNSKISHQSQVQSKDSPS